MRISFSSMTAARAAVGVLETYGYSAKQFGREVVTNCPTLLAIPAIQKRVGLAQIDHLDLTGGGLTAGLDVDHSESADDFPASAEMPNAMANCEMSV